jgi:hypothetical protein
MSKDKHAPEVRAHKEWLGFVQPVGLVVSMPALERAQCFVQKNVAEEQKALISILAPRKSEDEAARIEDLGRLCRDVLQWSDGDLAPADDRFRLFLAEYQDSICADFVVGDPASPIALVMCVDPSVDLDAPRTGSGWEGSPEARIERLLRDQNVPIGILFNQRALRLVYKPHVESSGHVTFVISDMITVAGRPILSGLTALLGADRLFNLPEAQRLPAILLESRLHQSEVSTRLSEQVLGALHALVRGFQAASDASDGRLFSSMSRDDMPEEVYGGLLTILLRLVFVLYAEDRGLMSKSPVYARHYSIGALFEKLVEDDARNPDTMDQRYGAWARLLTLFRLIHDGVAHGDLRLPARYGGLFDPDAYPFLEGRARAGGRQIGERILPPRISDGVIHRVLSSLLVLDGERLSYRTLDVEQIGSVYEAIMGFRLITVREPSVALAGKRKKGAPPSDPVIGLETLLASKDRAAFLQKEADVELSPKPAAALKVAKTIDELLAALGGRISPRSPGVLRAGSMALQPTEERRRSGSHYTPRALTEPIVEKTLRPVLEALGHEPTPEQILSLRACDPAMGSGAFLVASCRALGDALVKAWSKHGMPAIPADEDPILFARRTVAQRCLYGVDKNPFAVHLAKLSLWLVTLAKEHPFTFLDHALRAGDSLVGLSKEQIASFHWAPDEQAQPSLLRKIVSDRIARAVELRARIQAMAASDDTGEKRHLLEDADAELETVRRVGDRVIEAFFGEDKPRAREGALDAMRDRVFARVDDVGPSDLAKTLGPFHWELEFPEVFARDNPGFDAFVGNPPFLGGSRISSVLGHSHLDWMLTAAESAHGNADLVAFFFRRALALLRKGGCLGLIATNTIAQGDTRSTGLRWIVQHGGVIYDAKRRYKWPAGAAVIVSVVHIAKAPSRTIELVLDDRRVSRISAFLFHTGPDADPAQLAANANKSFLGSKIYGQGFLFDDGDEDATPLAEMQRLFAKDPRSRERIFPYLGGEELNTSPTHAHHRCVINFGQMSEEEARRWPDLMAIVEEKVKQERQALGDNPDGRRRKQYWWQWGRYTPALYASIANYDRVLACSLHSKDLSFAFLPSATVFSHGLAVFADETSSFFGVLQSRVHEIWARFFSSSLEDRLRYTPSDCFETFPFPRGWEHNATLESAGRAYYEFRAALMVRKDQGLTETYNRFHDPDERDAEILKLRELHAAMDRAVADAYDWTSLELRSEFLLDHEDDEDDGEDGARKRKKKPWRYRWPDDLRDEVLARLLALNAERAAEERRLGLEAALALPEAGDSSPASKKGGKKKPKKR